MRYKRLINENSKVDCVKLSVDQREVLEFLLNGCDIGYIERDSKGKLVGYYYQPTYFKGKRLDKENKTFDLNALANNLKWLHHNYPLDIAQTLKEGVYVYYTVDKTYEYMNENEYKLLHTIAETFNYVAKNRDGTLYAYKGEPVRGRNEYKANGSYKFFLDKGVYGDAFCKDLKFEDGVKDIKAQLSEWVKEG